MTAALTLAKPEHGDVLLPLVAAFHAEEGIEMSDAQRVDALGPLLQGSPLGVVYLIGPPKAPIGYTIVCFGWSIEFGGMDGFIDEIYIRPGVRGRGIASEVLRSLPKALAEVGMKAIHLEVNVENERAQKLYSRTGFKMRDQYKLMTRLL